MPAASADRDERHLRDHQLSRASGHCAGSCPLGPRIYRLVPGHFGRDFGSMSSPQKARECSFASGERSASEAEGPEHVIRIVDVVLTIISLRRGC